MTGSVRVVASPTAADLDRARGVVAANLQPTPVVPLPLPDGRRVLAKLDTLQPTGSFKVRGALVAVAAAAARGCRRVVAGSTGNHAQAIVHAAGRLGVAATVVVPEQVTPAKLAALRQTGADLVQWGEHSADAEQHARRLAEDADAAGGPAAFISPYNDPHVIAGQATWAAEAAGQIQRDPGDPLTLLVPVGGGGLLAGTALWAAEQPGVRVVGAEAAASRPVSAAVHAGRIVDVPVDPTLADGLAGNLEPGCITPQLIRGRVATITAVSEEEIATAVRWLAVERGLVTEGAGGVGVAALLSGKPPLDGQADSQVLLLLTGRNIATATLRGLL